ncbi:response regulator [Ornithinicoccus hortensis]|uniref:LuxR family two component transcriptional regulator n=1 Tax=Ornithinicoccus hortensis TaxID=82346 RepID=A0A542YWT3_9MICO|nr:response regulator transcription factor [Ornithinicoccus hortensis]TQL52444.1 LuxR family two component transcriptional regulator [Ornithinicoccus hortensis]
MDPIAGGEPLRVLLVDDQKLMLEAMRVFIDNVEDFTVVGEAADGVVAVQQARALRPDIVLMDLQMPRMDGVEATRAILEENPDLLVVAVTTFHSQEYVIPALKAGASGYLLKDSTPADIVAGVRAVVAGEFVISSQVTDVLVRSVREDQSPAPAQRSTPEELGLSDREMEVIELLCQGSSNREIAQQMHLAEPTVKSHIGRIMQKLDVRDRVQIVITAYRSGLAQL